MGALRAGTGPADCDSATRTEIDRDNWHCSLEGPPNDHENLWPGRESRRIREEEDEESVTGMVDILQRNL